MFNESIESSFTLSFDSWTSDRKTVNIQLEDQVYIGRAQNINSPDYLIVAHQTADRIGVPNINSIPVFDTLDVRKYFVDIDGVRYPRDALSIDYASNDYVDQYGDLEFFYKKYVGEELLCAFIDYTDMKNIYPIKVIDLRFQVDHINPKKIQLHQEYRDATANARLFMILIRHREIKMLSDGNKITEVTVL